MADDKSKVGRQDRARVASDEPYEIEDFHRKHKHLTHEEAVRIIQETKGDRKKADGSQSSADENRISVLKPPCSSFWSQLSWSSSWAR